jgi:predicted DNA binding protein
MLDAVKDANKIGTSRGGIELSEWEESFIESIEEQLDKKRVLTERQREVLKKLYDRT